MRTKKLKISVSSLIKFLVTLMVVYLVLLPLQVVVGLRLIRIISIVSFLAIIFLVAVENRYKCNKTTVLAVSLFVIVVLIDFIFYEVKPDVDNILSVFSVICLLILVSVSDKIVLDKELADYLFGCSVLMAFIELMYAFSKYAFWNGERDVIYLVLGIDNSNQTAIILFLILSLMAMTMQFRKKKLMPGMLCICLVIMIWLTRSRMVVIAAILVLVSLLVKIKRIPGVFVWGCCVIPILFVPFYMWLYSVINTVQFLGKDLFSGRQFTYMAYLESFDSQFAVFWGNLGANMFQNAHNGPLAIVTSVGFVGAICYFFILFSQIRKVYIKSQAHTNTALLVIMACMIHSCGEATLLLGGYPAIVFVFIMFIFANSRQKTEKW